MMPCIFQMQIMAGASILEVEDNRLDLKWICADGQIRDQFTMMKNVNKHQVIQLKKGEKKTLTASFIGKYTWNSSPSSERSLVVSPEKDQVYSVTDEFNVVKDTFEVHVSK